MARKNINTTLDEDLYSKIQKISFKVSAERGQKTNANDLIEEGMKFIIDKYKEK